MQHIFERFERGRRSDQTLGFGLGLWVARRVAQLHCGDVRVDSTPGRGHLLHAGVAAAARRQRQLRWWYGESRIMPGLLLLPL
ncbi:ATP-binding protein [Paenacidovorax caeni]|uniref:ATP-binding protein n=1 Tax=Paenacidovorax caeni TaxID=343013 RepID=UPI00094568AD|nr:sensor histidine kinase [Paenacidovorax caeni]